MAATLEDIRVKNRQLAASNLAQQGAIAEARNQLAVVRSSEYQVRGGGGGGSRISSSSSSSSSAASVLAAARCSLRGLCSTASAGCRRAPPPPPAPLPQAIRARFDALLARQAAVASVLGAPRFRERLEDAVCAADAGSSALSAAFLGGDLPLEGFVEQYVAARAQHHALDLKRVAAEHALAAGGGGGGGARV